MILVKKGAKVKKASENAFYSYLQASGWEKVTEEKPKAKKAAVEEQEQAPKARKPFSEMSAEELKAYAKEIGVKGKFKTKDEIIQAIIESEE